MSTSKRSPARQGIAERTDAKGATHYRGTAYCKRTGKRLRGQWTPNLAEARAWRVDALARLQAGTLSGDRGSTVLEAVDVFVAGIADGSIRNRSGHVYKPSAVRGYHRELRGRVVLAFGPSRLSELTLPDVQRWADALAAKGLSASTVRNIVTALRALYGWALPRGMAQVNPTVGLRLPTGEQARDRIATPEEASKLIAALTPRDQAALGLAVYAGLRLGELLALDWSAVDVEAGTLRVERSWDHGARRFVAPKSKAGRRTVPIIGRLALLLSDHRVLTNQGDGLLFPGTRDPQCPVSHNALRHRMSAAWETGKLTPLGIHEARHTYAALMIAASVNAKALSTYMGHANIAVTFDRYGHLMPGNEAEAAGLLDAYLARFE
jgi:integrase